MFLLYTVPCHLTYHASLSRHLLCLTSFSSLRDTVVPVIRLILLQRMKCTVYKETSATQIILEYLFVPACTVPIFAHVYHFFVWSLFIRMHLF